MAAEHRCPIEVATFDNMSERCGREAGHKVEEVVEDDSRHPLSAYVCCFHFGKIMGQAAQARCAAGLGECRK